MWPPTPRYVVPGVDPAAGSEHLRRNEGEGSFVTDTTTTIAAPADANGSGRQATGLSAKRLPELQAIAAELGISATGRMRKSDPRVGDHEPPGRQHTTATAPDRRCSSRAHSRHACPGQRTEGHRARPRGWGRRAARDRPAIGDARRPQPRRPACGRRPGT